MMGLIESGIDRVSTVRLAAGVGNDGRSVDEPLSLLVRWRSFNDGKLHQVYVNGVFAGLTSDEEQRSLVVPVVSSWVGCLWVEVFAVDVSEGHVDFGGELGNGGQLGRIEIGWDRGMGLPFAGCAVVYSDGLAVSEEIGLWNVWQDKNGFGVALFGVGDFGYEGCAAVGFGIGVFGGEFGFGCDEVVWLSDEMESDEYGFSVKVKDSLGNEDSGVESGDVVVVRQAGGVKDLKIESFDKATGELVIGVD